MNITTWRNPADLKAETGRYTARLQGMDDDALGKEAEQMIWLSAYASNNPRSDYHWQADFCYYECQRRGKPEIYDRAYKRARESA